MLLARFVSLIALLVLSSSPPLCQASPRLGGGWFWGGGANGEERIWSSMMTVDPSKIISYMMKHGGLLIPKASRKELEVFAKVCHADQVRLNVVEKKLEVKNFVVQLPGEEEALRIGRVYVHWDSYLTPCIEIAVTDVSILVEFHTVIFTKNNWNDLKKNGFPPELPDDPQPQKPSNPKKGKDSFVRIGSIDLSGKVVALVKSRPLKKDLAEVKFTLDSLDPLDEQIKTQSLENLANTGKRGCTTDELYTVIQAFIGGMIKQALTETIEDVASGGSKTFGKVENVVTLTKKSISTYVDDAGEWSGKELHNKLKHSISKLGVSSDDPEGKQVLSLISKRLQKSSDSILPKNERLQSFFKNIFGDDEGSEGQSNN